MRYLSAFTVGLLTTLFILPSASGHTMFVTFLSTKERPALEVIDKGRIYTYRDPNGTLSLWLVAYEATRLVRERNYLEPYQTSRREMERVGEGTALGGELMRRLADMPWHKELPASVRSSKTLSYLQFFDHVLPHISREFAKIASTDILIERYDGKERSLKTRVNCGDHPMAHVYESLPLEWIPSKRSRTPTSIHFKSATRRW